MSYSEENGQIVLTMSPEDYDRLLQVFAIATVSGTKPGWPVNREVLNLLDRLNQGNPNYTPYQVEDVGEEIRTALTTDPDLRILVRECIKEAIAQMNVQEVIAQAVKAALSAPPK